jgi:putative membrane protein (TIGR04086 family)
VRRTEVDVPAVGRGAVVGAALALPAAIVQNLVPSDSSLRSLMLAVIVVALAWCGWVAAKAAGRDVVLHGGLAALAAFVIVQLIGVVLRFARGEALHPVAIVFTALLSTICGMIGAHLGLRREQRREASSPEGPGGNQP